MQKIYITIETHLEKHEQKMAKNKTYFLFFF